MVLLRQISYAIKNQLKACKMGILCLSLYNYAILKRAGSATSLICPRHGVDQPEQNVVFSFLPRDIMKVDRVHKWKSNDPESVVDQQYSRETQDRHSVETVVGDDQHSPRCVKLVSRLSSHQ